MGLYWRGIYRSRSSSSTARACAVKTWRIGSLQAGNILLEGVPHDVQFQGGVAMTEGIPHPSHGTPGNRPMLGSKQLKRLFRRIDRAHQLEDNSA